VLAFDDRGEFLKGVYAGAIAGMVRYSFREILQVLGVTQFDTNSTSLGVLMNQAPPGLGATVLGFIATLIIGAFWGVVISFVFTIVLSHEQYLLKGTLLGIGIWLFEFGFAAEAFGYPPEMLNGGLAEVTSILVGLAIYGAATAFLLKRFEVIRPSRP